MATGKRESGGVSGTDARTVLGSGIPLTSHIGRSSRVHLEPARRQSHHDTGRLRDLAVPGEWPRSTA